MLVIGRALAWLLTVATFAFILVGIAAWFFPRDTAWLFWQFGIRMFPNYP